MIKTLLRSFNEAGFPLFLDNRINHFAVLFGQYPLVSLSHRFLHIGLFSVCVETETHGMNSMNRYKKSTNTLVKGQYYGDKDDSK